MATSCGRSPAPGAWSANPLANGNVLITDRLGVREVTRRGDTVWSWTPADAPGYKFASLQEAWRLANGDTVINNWVNEWTNNADNAPGSAQAIEVTRRSRLCGRCASGALPNAPWAGDVDPVSGPAGDDGGGGCSLRRDQV